MTVAARIQKVEIIKKKKSAGVVPVLDQTTFWGDIFLMITSKTCLTEMVNPKLTLLDVIWDQVGRLRNIAQPFIATKKNSKGNFKLNSWSVF